MRTPVRIVGVLFVALALSPAQDQPPVDWIRDRAIPLDTVQAGSGFADLQPLKNIVGDSRIVSLGEATHGAREFFQMKHRILEFLATEMGFNLFAIEANMPEAYRVNDYVLTGVGDPKQLLAGLQEWPWNTEEVLDMIRWMRQFNASGRGPVQFTGFDMQIPGLAAAIVHDFLSTTDPDSVDALDAIYADAIRQTSFGAGYALAYGRLPAGARRWRISGMVRTEGITRGAAGLFCTLADDWGNMLIGDTPVVRGLKGSNGWNPYEVVFDIPPGATNYQFAPYHAGDGSAWFDALTVEINGVPYPTSLDLGFESPNARGFLLGGAGYSVGVDSSIAFSGRQSLRSRYLGPSAAETASAAAAVADRMEAARAAYLAGGRSDWEIDWAIQNARIVAEAVQHACDATVRDPAMARNVQWILDRNPGGRIVLWAHNLHVATGGYEGSPWTMGSRLREMYGAGLVTIGFAFNQGGFQAVGTSGLREFTVDPAPAGTLDAAFAATGIPIFALPLKDAPETGPASWLRSPQLSRIVGAGYAEGANYFFPVNAPQAFDAMLFIDRTTRARPVDSPPQ